MAHRRGVAGTGGRTVDATTAAENPNLAGWVTLGIPDDEEEYRASRDGRLHPRTTSAPTTAPALTSTAPTVVRADRMLFIVTSALLVGLVGVALVYLGARP